MNRYEYKDMIAFHPGYYIKEYIEETNMSESELAKQLHTSPEYITDLIDGNVHLTDDMMHQLSVVFNTSTILWQGLNKKYIDKMRDIEKEIELDKECELSQQMA